MATKKVAKLSEGSLKALEMLKGGTNTAQGLKELGFEGLNSAHLKALENRGLVTAVEVEKEVVTVVRRKVKEYTITDDGMTYKGE